MNAREQWRAAYRMARLVRGFELRLNDGERVSLSDSLPWSPRAATFRYGDRLVSPIRVRLMMGVSWVVGREAIEGPCGVLPA